MKYWSPPPPDKTTTDIYYTSPGYSPTPPRDTPTILHFWCLLSKAYTHTIFWQKAHSTWQVWWGSCKFHLHARTAKWICKHANSPNFTSPQPVTGTGNNWQQLTSITIYMAVWWKKKLSTCVCMCGVCVCSDLRFITYSAIHVQNDWTSHEQWHKKTVLSNIIQSLLNKKYFLHWYSF